jgi:hypothetical protein
MMRADLHERGEVTSPAFKVSTNLCGIYRRGDDPEPAHLFFDIGK